MRTSNPVFNSSTFQRPTAYADLDAEVASGAGAVPKADSKVMTVRGTAIKTGYLLAITVATAAMSWNYFVANPNMILVTSIGALVGGLIAGFVIMRTPKVASFVVPVFAIAEGAFVAAISVAVVHYSSLAQRIAPAGATKDEANAAGFELVGQAAGLTFAVAAAVLIGYATGLLRLSGMAMKMIGVMTGAVMLYYAAAFLINMVAGDVVPRLGWDAGPIGIGFSIFVVILASLNLLMDFQMIDEGAKRRMPKHMEWVGAFGLLTTLVWLYIELLRLLAKLRSSN